MHLLPGVLSGLQVIAVVRFSSPADAHRAEDEAFMWQEKYHVSCLPPPSKKTLLLLGKALPEVMQSTTVARKDNSGYRVYRFPEFSPRQLAISNLGFNTDVSAPQFHPCLQPRMFLPANNFNLFKTNIPKNRFAGAESPENITPSEQYTLHQKLLAEIGEALCTILAYHVATSVMSKETVAEHFQRFGKLKNVCIYRKGDVIPLTLWKTLFKMHLLPGVLSGLQVIAVVRFSSPADAHRAEDESFIWKEKYHVSCLPPPSKKTLLRLGKALPEVMQSTTEARKDNPGYRVYRSPEVSPRPLAISNLEFDADVSAPQFHPRLQPRMFLPANNFNLFNSGRFGRWPSNLTLLHPAMPSFQYTFNLPNFLEFECP